MGLGIEDRLDILDLFARYCQYIDAGRAAEWVDLFTPDGCFDIVGQMRLNGAEQLAGMPAMLAENSNGKWRHQITDIVIDPGAAADTARVSASGLVTDWNEGGRVLMFSNYHADLRKSGVRWKIQRLTATMLAG